MFRSPRRGLIDQPRPNLQRVPSFRHSIPATREDGGLQTISRVVHCREHIREVSVAIDEDHRGERLFPCPLRIWLNTGKNCRFQNVLPSLTANDQLCPLLNVFSDPSFL